MSTTYLDKWMTGDDESGIEEETGDDESGDDESGDEESGDEESGDDESGAARKRPARGKRPIKGKRGLVRGYSGAPLMRSKEEVIGARRLQRFTMANDLIRKMPVKSLVRYVQANVASAAALAIAPQQIALDSIVTMAVCTTEVADNFAVALTFGDKSLLGFGADQDLASFGATSTLQYMRIEIGPFEFPPSAGIAIAGNNFDADAHNFRFSLWGVSKSDIVNMAGPEAWKLLQAACRPL